MFYKPGFMGMVAFNPEYLGLTQGWLADSLCDVWSSMYYHLIGQQSSDSESVRNKPKH